MANNTTGDNNTASGFEVLQANSTGNNNTATGYEALFNSTTGIGNLAGGASSLFSNTTGNYNVAAGVNALYNNTTGVNNVALGYEAMQNNVAASNNTALGTVALLKSTGSNNIGVGAGAGSSLTSGNYNIDLGNKGVAGDASTVRLGTAPFQTNVYVAGVSGVTVAGGVPVVVDANGHLGTKNSSARFKEDIKSMDAASESILALRPVTFRYKPELDPEGIAQFGLVAEEVEKVNPALVARDAAGKAYTVRYEAVNAMLLNEFLKERRRGDAQADAIRELRAALARQQEMTAALAGRIDAASGALRSGGGVPQP